MLSTWERFLINFSVMTLIKSGNLSLVDGTRIQGSSFGATRGLGVLSSTIGVDAGGVYGGGGGIFSR